MSPAARNIALYPWFKFFQNLMFWQAIWFLFFQSELSASEAVLIYVASEISTTAFEVPSGYLSDRTGRRLTLLLSALAGLFAALLHVVGDGFLAFLVAQIAFGIHFAFASGTDTSLLYESLTEEGREDEVEQQELKAWRYSFVAMAVSGVVGGALALWGLRIPYIATAAAFAVLLIVTLTFREPALRNRATSEWARATRLWAAMRAPVLRWLFAMWILMYAFGHLPFVFGQPIIQSILEGIEEGANAPLVSGIVSSLMIIASIIASWVAVYVRARVGLVAILLLALILQIGLAAALAYGSGLFVIALLLLRKVPEGFSRPFMLARMQQELSDDVRATYLSVQSLVAKLAYSGSLFFAAGAASNVGAMTYAEIRVILTGYTVAGAIAFIALALTAGRSWANVARV
ncbi:MAG: MFS transporter [Pseudomonadota bacterium]